MLISVSLTPLFHINPQASGSVEGIRDVLDFYRIGGDQDANDIELIQLSSAAVAVNPDLGALGQFALFAVMYGFDGIAEFIAFARFHFDEGDVVLALRDEIDVAAAEFESAGEDGVAVLAEPAFGDAFAELAECLVVCGHGARECAPNSAFCVTESLPA